MSSQPQPDTDTEAARAVVNIIVRWVVSPLVETGKAVCDRMDRVSGALERIADGFDRVAPKSPNKEP